MQKYSVLDIYRLIHEEGEVISPRGDEGKEIQYFQGEITSPWSNYTHRNYPIDYFKREFQWFLSRDKFDLRICDHAKVWKKLVQDDGSIFSNYGALWFNGGFQGVVETLKNDPSARHAYIPMLNVSHMFPGNKDVVCTKGIHFMIRDNKLNIHVDMRSSDSVWGLATDLPCFWYLWRMVAIKVGVDTGKFIFSADSLHYYDYHYDLIDRILSEPTKYPLHVPPLDDVDDLLNGNYQSEFGRWLMEAPL